MLNPKISVFTSSYNHSKYLRQAIESVLNQTYDNFEYFLFDDGSTDSTHDIMKEYEDNEKVKVFKLEKQDNVGVVINKSFELSEGDYWCWCPADDFFHGNLLLEKVKYMEKYPKSVLYNNWFVIDDSGKIKNSHTVKPMTAEEFKKEVWETSPIGFTGILIPKYVYKNLPFPTHLKYSEDFYWMVKATIHDIPFNNVPLKLHYKRKHNNSLTRQNIKKILKQVPIIWDELREYEKQLKNESNIA